MAAYLEACIEESQQDGTRFVDEEISHSMAREGISYLFGLAVFKRGHIRANLEGSVRTSADSLPLFRMSDTKHHRVQAYRCG